MSNEDHEPSDLRSFVPVQYAVVAALLLAFWGAMAVAVLVTFSLTAWESRADAGSAAAPPAATATPAPSAEPPRPQGVPAAAVYVSSSTTVGDGVDTRYNFYDLVCGGGVMTIVTTGADVYAELPCERAPSRGQILALLGQPAQINVAEGQLTLRAGVAPQRAFAADNVWILER